MMAFYLENLVCKCITFKQKNCTDSQSSLLQSRCVKTSKISSNKSNVCKYQVHILYLRVINLPIYQKQTCSIEKRNFKYTYVQLDKLKKIKEQKFCFSQKLIKKGDLLNWN